MYPTLDLCTREGRVGHSRGLCNSTEEILFYVIESLTLLQFDMEPTTDPFLARLQLYIDLEGRLLICGRSECGYALAVERSQVTSHLRDKHHVVLDMAPPERTAPTLNAIMSGRLRTPEAVGLTL